MRLKLILEKFWSIFKGFSLLHISVSFEPLKLLLNILRDVVGDVVLGFHSSVI